MEAISIEAETIRLSLKCHHCGAAHEFDASLARPNWSANCERKRIGWHRRHVGGFLRDTCGDCGVTCRREAMNARYVPSSKPRVSSSKINIEEAVELFNSGWTLKQLGDKYDVSRERVRQKITTLVNHDRTRQVTCAVCGNEFAVGAGSGGRKAICSDKCATVQAKKSRTNKCECGRDKTHTASKCQNCYGISIRTFDHQLAAYLYDHAATAKQVANFLKAKPITVYKAVGRLGSPPHGKAFRATLKPSDLRRLAAEYRKQKKAS